MGVQLVSSRIGFKQGLILDDALDLVRTCLGIGNENCYPEHQNFPETLVYV